MDSERIAICKEFQPARLKIASSQFLGGSRLSGSALEAKGGAAFPTGTLPVQDNALGAAQAPSPWGSAAGEEAALPLRALGRRRVPLAVPLTNLYFLFQTQTNPASRLQCVQTSPLRDAVKTRGSPTPSREVKFAGNEVRWCGGAATKREK